MSTFLEKLCITSLYETKALQLWISTCTAVTATKWPNAGNIETTFHVFQKLFVVLTKLKILSLFILFIWTRWYGPLVRTYQSKTFVQLFLPFLLSFFLHFFLFLSFPPLFVFFLLFCLYFFLSYSYSSFFLITVSFSAPNILCKAFHIKHSGGDVPFRIAC